MWWASTRWDRASARAATLAAAPSKARRPATADNAPLLGRCRHADGTNTSGLLVATGFFRHGVLLAPLAARACADLIDGAGTLVDLERYRPDRFAGTLPESPVTGRNAVILEETL